MLTGNQQILVIRIETKGNYRLSGCRSWESLEYEGKNMDYHNCGIIQFSKLVNKD